MNALFIGENQRVWWHLVSHLQHRGCSCWFASTDEELRELLKHRAFHLVLSARPVIEGTPLMEMLQARERFVFYSFPVEDSCLWFQAIPSVPRASALRPSEFVSALNALLVSESVSLAPGSQVRTDMEIHPVTRQPLTFLR